MMKIRADIPCEWTAGRLFRRNIEPCLLHQALFSLIIKKDTIKFAACCSWDWLKEIKSQSS